MNTATNTIRSQLIRNRPPPNEDPTLSSGVYKIPCKNCDKVYFGQTGRPFKKRIKEHESDHRHKRPTNACYYHTLKTGHEIDFSNWKIIHQSNNYSERLVVESTLINSFSNFNKCSSTLNIDQHSAKAILNSRSKLRLEIT